MPRLLRLIQYIVVAELTLVLQILEWMEKLFEVIVRIFAPITLNLTHMGCRARVISVVQHHSHHNSAR